MCRLTHTAFFMEESKAHHFIRQRLFWVGCNRFVIYSKQMCKHSFTASKHMWRFFASRKMR